MNITALLAGLFSGILGSMGLGGGAVLVIYLSVFANVKHLSAQGINLIFFIPIATISLIIYSYKKQIKWKLTLKIALWGILGTVSGFMLTDFLGGKITAKLFGGLLILMGIKEIFAKANKKVAKRDKNCYTEIE